MGTIADKLAYTKQAREEIRNAIVSKGVDCPGTAPFCQFDEYIAQIGSNTIQPVFEMPLSSSLDFTGTLACSVNVVGQAIVFNDNAFSATTYSGIELNFASSLEECTITLDFKINSTGLSSYPQYRRILWGFYNSTTSIKVELGYTYYSSTNSVTFQNNSVSDKRLDDGAWHTLTIKKIGKAIICIVDDSLFYAANAESGSSALNQLALSHSDYSLNGFIKNLRIYDKML